MPIVRKHTVLYYRTVIEERTKTLGECIKWVFGQTSTNEEKQKLKVQINYVIQGLVDTGTDILVISLKFCYPNWLLKYENVQFLEIETLY